LKVRGASSTRPGWPASSASSSAVVGAGGCKAYTETAGLQATSAELLVLEMQVAVVVTRR
jgi:hypothetical protein